MNAPANEPRTATVVVDDGTEIAYHRWDPDGAAHPVPVVLQHGFTVDTRVEWASRGIVPALTATGRTVVGIDARGHGLSQKSPDPGRYGETRMARDLLTVVDLLDAPAFDLVGYSMGAIISLLAATGEPRVRRLVIGGVGAGVVEVGGVDTRVLRNDALAEALLADDPSTLPPELAGMRASATQSGADLRSMAAQALALHTAGVDFARITADAIVIAGDEDPLAVRPEVLADAIPGARLVLVPGDHGAAINSAEFSTAVVDFLRD
ncbi:alpha/beta fold hydrolase [Lentzea fradiae]|uniref:alpha/beta fold hydrolase n=1 Tax=Lentzea fradiae TaxID=200378 RepID=UPI001C40AA4C|nr:alpha/beta fold hydrolase [Lentzea fradiae]